MTHIHTNIKTLNQWSIYEIKHSTFVLLHMYVCMYACPCMCCVCPCLCACVQVYMCVCVHRCICQCMSMFVVQGWLTSFSFIDHSPLCFMRCVFWYQISLNLASLANNSCRDLHICLLSAGITSGCRGCLPFMWVLGLWALVFTLILQALYPHSSLPSHTVFVCLSPGYLV